MSSDAPAISVRHLSKTYTIRHGPTDHFTFAEAVLDRLRHPFRRMEKEEFPALADVSFDVRPGERLGIVGANGAGKSTILKILSRITEPTGGEIEIFGRVGSLLEVGTGFHRELTGRENIFLNGAILGMSRAETRRRFDEIVDFSGVERFLDTPVKRYSSGMYVRLAFAVAAHLSSDILLVDEVLAVGDEDFQRKCLSKMDDVARGGRTVLFVSHNMATMRALCDRALFLKEGRLELDGTPEACARAYLRGRARAGRSGAVAFDDAGARPVRMEAARILADGEPTARPEMGSRLALEVDVDADAAFRPALGVIVLNEDGVRVLHTSTRYAPAPELAKPVRRGTIRCDLGMVPLTPGDYYVSLYLGDPTGDHHVAESCLSFRMTERDVGGIGRPYQSRHSVLWWPADLRFVERRTLARVPSGDDGEAE